MSTHAASLLGLPAFSPTALLTAVLPLAVGLSVAQVGVLGSQFLASSNSGIASSNPGIVMSDGGAAEAPEGSCVGCHFETPADEGAAGPTGQTAEAAHQKFAAAAGLRDAGMAMRARQP